MSEQERARYEPVPAVTPRLVFGVVLMAAGVLFTLDNFGVVRAEQWVRFWPLALVAVGLSRLQAAMSGRAQAAAAVWIAAGLGLLADSLGWIPEGGFWPLVMIAGGAYLVFQGVPGLTRGSLVLPGGPDNQLSATVFMCGVNRRTRTGDFRGGEFTAVMGGAEVDLRHASIAHSPAVIDTFALWGGIEIRVPESWNVESHGVALLGGFEDKTDHPVDASQTLIVKGVAIMGGVEIKN